MLTLEFLMKIAITIAFGLLCIPNSVHAQAFGVVAGAPVSNYAPTPTKEKFTFRIKVPNPNSEFEEYIALATPNAGICKVTGIGKNHNNDSYGNSIRQSFETLQSALSEKYGQSKSYDFLKSGSIWKDDNDFAMGLVKNERNLVSFWDSQNSSGNFGKLSGIMLKAHALGSSTTYLNLDYEFNNLSKCRENLDEVENKGL